MAKFKLPCLIITYDCVRRESYEYYGEVVWKTTFLWDNVLSLHAHCTVAEHAVASSSRVKGIIKKSRQ
jgi:hypothetical protein